MDVLVATLATVHAVPNVDLDNFIYRQVFKIICAFWMEPAFMRANIFASFTCDHKFLLNLTFADAILGEIAKIDQAIGGSVQLILDVSLMVS